MFSARMPRSLRPSLWPLLPALRGLGVRGWVVAVVAAAAGAMLMGLPTVMFGNPWFGRMTPTRTQDYVFWIVSAVLLGLIAGTFVGKQPAPAEKAAEKSAATGGVLSTLAIGCPVCNKVVVLLIGTSGALTYFAPAQLVIGAASVALLFWTLLLRADAVTASSCPV